MELDSSQAITQVKPNVYDHSGRFGYWGPRMAGRERMAVSRRHTFSRHDSSALHELPGVDVSGAYCMMDSW